jgi:DNA repair photolyase
MSLPPPDPFLRLKARGSATNASGRFEPYERIVENDGWDIAEDERLLRTTVSEETPRSLINYIASPDLPFDRTINPFRGCEHGCTYCFARPTHAYLGLSPGLDFETKLTARPDAPRVLARELGRKSYVPQTIAIGTNTDPYQPVEARYRIMRGILQVLSDWNHPVSIVTKGALIERDIDILSDMARRNLVHVGISVTTLDERLCRSLEPRAPAPKRRIAAIKALTDAGIPVRVMVAPVIPVLTEPELEAILKVAADAGASTASWILLRLPLEVAPLFRDWLEREQQGQAAHVMNRLKEMRGGADYDSEWGKRMCGEGVHAELIAKRFAVAVKRLGLDRASQSLDISRFGRPPKAGDQLSLF